MKKILVIEKDKKICNKLFNLLTKEQYEVLCAENSEAGLKAVWSFHPDLIFCAVKLDELDGYQVLSAIRKNPHTSTLPFIFLTMHKEREKLRLGMTLGADDYITKPFTDDDILKAISTRFERKEALERQVTQRTIQFSELFAGAIPNETAKNISTISVLSEILFNNSRLNPDPKIIQEISREIFETSRKLESMVRNYQVLIELRRITNQPGKMADLRKAVDSHANRTILDLINAEASIFDRTRDLHINLEQVMLAMAEIYLQQLIENIMQIALFQTNPGEPINIQGRKSNNGNQYELVIWSSSEIFDNLQKDILYSPLAPHLENYTEVHYPTELLVIRAILDLHLGRCFSQNIKDGTGDIIISLPIAIS